MIIIKYIKGIVSIALLIFSSSILIQKSLAQERGRRVFDEYRMNKNRESLIVDIAGSPYTKPSFSEGWISLKDNDSAFVVPLRYNNCFDEMEYKEDGSESFLLLVNKSDVDTILLNNERYIFLTADDKGTPGGYFIVLTNGKCNLLLKKSIKLQEEVIPTGGYQDYKPAEFIPNPDKFYVQFYDGEVLEILP